MKDYDDGTKEWRISVVYEDGTNGLSSSFFTRESAFDYFYAIKREISETNGTVIMHKY